MIKAYDVATIRALEAQAIEQVGADTLMQRAARGLAAIAIRELIKVSGGVYGRRVLVLVGPGNNGGDALFAGARVAGRGASVTAVRCLGTPHQRGLAALRATGGRLLELDDLGLDDDVPPGIVTAADLVLDGVLGIGGRPGLPDDVGVLAGICERRGIPTIAVDLPSGVDADTGADPEASFKATRTVTFGELKPCHLLEPARTRCGEVDLVDIGLPDRDPDAPGRWLDQFQPLDLEIGWPYPDATSDKYSRGVVGIDTGSDDYPGAGVMSVCGAVYAGAGMVRFLGAQAPADLIRNRLPNVVFSPGRVQAHLLGSGWGERADGHRVVADALDSGLPAVVDADGLKYLPDEVPPSWLLTPHAGELARLLDQDRSWVTANPVRAVCAAAERTGATVLLKGATQLVAEPGSQRVQVAVPGPAWTAQAGSGDVLGGICATVLAAGFNAASAALFGASLQAITARRHPGPIPPVELAELLPAEIAQLQRERIAR